ncbi:hypothetical protein CC86DRAFT_373782 [Ophiobolus disseminans]|uniref:Uncharacterized protein n=1 Tax=Ophiobolus disseminans TaxID=1469910 RepID=A0A6A6ZL00_9PLEO|nr:hypothetical protein CC86DRAFT_373782 [Ophiobolus disseminans]
MALPSTHILSLPRELRDRIFEYIRHAVTHSWTRESSDTKHLMNFTITVQNAPRLNAILVCSRFHEELVESTKSQGLSVTMAFTGHLYGPDDKASSPATHCKLDAIFTHATKVHLLLHEIPLYTALVDTVNELNSKLPHKLTTFIIAKKNFAGYLTNDYVPKAETVYPANDRPLYDGLLPLLGPIRGLQFSRIFSFMRLDSNGAPKDWTSVWSEERNGLAKMTHRVDRYEFHVYAGPGRAEPVETQDVELIWPPDGWGTQMDDALQAEDAGEVEYYVPRIWGWEEMQKERIPAFVGAA